MTEGHSSMMYAVSFVHIIHYNPMFTHLEKNTSC